MLILVCGGAGVPANRLDAGLAPRAGGGCTGRGGARVVGAPAGRRAADPRRPPDTSQPSRVAVLATATESPIRT
ncbi:hypothetical protein LX15_006374 [Streptoalloteichus tenebrarius]|uniref:Uncharacterized protein n=1 Tax=Streptoalloteichus tenebrarius (strain ATCC 17920 / DSM 40477 / JCM 4838 / CBS 697.72 / NBRC 16177 / NCIMB 11028 / NRRL B-12390 / A12253. 1 / ISP 5477) TaxID=1933 RepID=A0ABT1I4A6_STRSD|nr:hypothetical protein [Streptoalloteichus tenebrarius]